MRFRPLVFYFLLVAILAFGKQASKEPDFANISGTNFESPFFQFHYSFPKGWSPEDDQIRVAKNRKKHEESTASLKADTSRTVNNGTTTTKVFWVYDLLVATPEPLPPDGKLPLPYVRIWAMERSNMINKPGDNAKLLAGLDGRAAAYSITLLQKPQEQTIANHQFVHSGFVFGSSHFEALFETLSGKYLLFFEFHGKNEQEINDLAKTMGSVKFED